MKKIVSLAILAFLVLSCSVEPVQLEAAETKVTITQLRLPVWLQGTYEGIHTQQPLDVTDTLIVFAFSGTTYEYAPEDIVQEIHEEGRYLLYTADETVLIFNKTTKPDEINLRFNELNLGWFRLVQPE
jgi:hypothetical protein